MSERDAIRKIINNDSALPEKSIQGECPANIAIVKYWGKLPGQIPVNPSLSFSLEKSVSKTRIHFQPRSGKDSVQVLFRFDGKPNQKFGQRVEKYLGEIQNEIPWVSELKLTIDSKNTFPDSAGIASSASAFGALALTLAEYEFQLTYRDDQEALLMRASHLARLGSGSAARSVFGGYASWGETPAMTGSSNFHAHQVEVHPVFNDIYDAILLVSSGEKPVSSSKGHALMESNPFKQARIKQAYANHSALLEILKNGNVNEFIDLAENEALTLHAMMMTSSPGYTLLQPGSLSIMESVRRFRAKTGIPIGFTIDAGPNIHLLYFGKNRKEVLQFIQDELLQFCNKKQWIDDKMGNGPRIIR